ncbi:MAG: hypothetical protein RIR85_669 [Pseudomonadota bacterium]|jgi:hypothetical protein
MAAKKTYILFGKDGINQWLPIPTLYPELDTKNYSFETLIEAQLAKRDLKNYLKVYRPAHKVPIRISCIIESA